MFNKPVSSPVLIGREVEVANLRAIVDRVKQGLGQIVLLSGEAGIGKSRLAGEVKTQAQKQGFQILQGNCFPTDRSSPYAPVLDLLMSPSNRELLAQTAADLKTIARQLVRLHPSNSPAEGGDTRTGPANPESERRRSFLALNHFFVGLATKQPLLLIIEDIHWSDDASLDLLHQLARQSAHHPILVILTYRNDESHFGLRSWLAQLDREHLAHEFALIPLSRSDVEAMLKVILDRPGPVPPSTLEALYELTDGNPFFVEEVVKSLVVAGAAVSDPNIWDGQTLPDVHVPRSVQDAVQQRLARVSDAARQVAILAAVAGRRFDFALLQGITHHLEPALLTLMKELIDAQLVVEESEEQFAFRHALTRGAIYRQLLLRERKILHRAIAETIEDLFSPTREAHLAELAYHLFEAGVWEKALAYAERAADRALASYAPRAAIEQLSLALKAAHHLATAPLARLYRSRGQAYETLGEFEVARGDYEAALHAARSAGDGRLQWQALIDLGFLWAGRDYAQTGLFFRQAVSLAEQVGNPTLRAHSLNRLGNWLVNTGQIAEGLAAHQGALDIFQRQDDQAGMAETFDLLGMTYAWSGDLVQGRQQQERAIALFRLLGDKRSLISILPNASIGISPAVAEAAVVAVREPEECEREAQEAADLARQIDAPAGEAYAELTTGALLASFGQFGRALAHALKGLRLAVEIEHQQWIVGAHCNFGQVYVLMLEPTLALHHLSEALPLAEKLGSAYWLDTIRLYQARAYLLEGQHERAEAALQAAMPREREPRTLAERRTALAWSELALAQGEPHVALHGAERLIASAAGERPTPLIPRLWKLKGEALAALRRPSEAVESLEAAERGALDRREVAVLWQIHGSLGRVYRALKHELNASKALLAAREEIESLAQSIDDAERREHFVRTALGSLPRVKPLSVRRAEAESTAD
jgi:tetratricopeptide (TPR) repeat protein